MRLLITGASGFIGTNAIAYFSGAGVDLRNLDLHPPLNPAHHGFWRKTDIMDREALREAVCAYAPTHLIHMAARTDCDENTTVEKDYAVNTIGTENILAAVQDCASIKRVIMVSSQYVCGPGRLPEHDEDFFPHTVYGQSKVLTERATRKAGLKCVWTLVRPVNIWGPWHLRYAREAWRVIRRGLYLHPAGAPVIRSYGYVGNVVWQMDRILKAPADQVDGRVFYLGDLPIDIIEWVNAFSLALRGRPVRSVPRPVLRLLGMIGSALLPVGIRFPITLSRVRSMTQDYRTPMDKTMAAFGTPPFTLEDGVAETVRWLRSDDEASGFRPVNNKAVMMDAVEDLRFPVLAAHLSAVRPTDVVARVLAMVAARERGYIHVCTVHTMLECADDPRMAAIVNNSTLAVPDGMPLVWLGRRAFPGAGVERCYGPDLMLAICKAGLATGLRHCLYGGAPDVLELLEQKLKAKFTGLDVVERISPPFRDLAEAEKQQMADRINAARSDVVWVGLGTPKQDLWMGEFRSKLEAPVLIAVGAAFNFHAGRLAQAPRWMQRTGLEWLYRLLREPRRLWRRYLLGNPRFLWLLWRANR